MVDLNPQHNDPGALGNGETLRSSPCLALEQAEEQPIAVSSNYTDVSGNAMGVQNTAVTEDFFAPGSASMPAYVEQAVSNSFAYSRALSPLSGQTHEATPVTHPDDASTSTTRACQHSVKLDKGKRRARSRSEPAETKEPLPLLIPARSGDQAPSARPGLVLTIPSGGCTIPQSPASATSQPSLRRPKQVYSVNQGHDDYPHVHGPRSISRRGALQYQPRHNLPRPRNMRHYRHVTSYAGEPLFRLCRSVPYVLGTRALVTRLQLIVETPVVLPDEVEEFLAARDIDISSLNNYDLALLNVLCCIATKSTEEPTHTDHRLELYFLRRHAIVHRRYCNILEFIVHMKRWQQLPNPARVLDYDGDTITWTHIVDRLAEFDVDFRELDGPLYEKLRACEDDDALTARLFEIKFLQTSGTLAQRCKRWKDHGDAIVDGQLKNETDRRYPMGLNNKRFSHRYPLGVDVNDFEAEPFEWTADGTARQSDKDKKQQRQLAQLTKPGEWWTALEAKDSDPQATAGVCVPDRRHVRLINCARGGVRPERLPANYIKGREPPASRQSYEKNFLGSGEDGDSIHRLGPVNNVGSICAQHRELEIIKMRARYRVPTADTTLFH
ncbi:hypothetical protein SVAN01_09134 [Stagonosporopsis vannaccii]|nr:hypothetical protein SVAN01_09134 [Stagonosporopsis vannaccii]